MGWLFAVSNGMFERRARAVFAALVPIGVGHLLAMAVVLLPVAVVSALATRSTIVRVVAGAVIIVFGVYRLVVRRHPRVLARIGARHLVLWSFVMATAHGAALMLVPVYFGVTSMSHGPTSGDMSGRAGAHAATMAAVGHIGEGLTAAAAVAIVHTFAMLIVAGIIAWIFYRFVGLALLRRVWFNMDIVWATALIAAGILATL